MSEPSIDKLGPYRIEKVVGRGGMGSVFSARHEETGEKAAIKVLAPALASDESFRERFVAEIESLETLNHPHIVKLHGYGESDGHLYYSMELVEGTNLEQELAAGRRFSWREVTQIGIDIARALKHAHDHGVIHRDLKPANLLVDQHDVVKLTDFGIAKLFGTTRQTYNGSVLGTADYMSPEQTAGEPTTPRCDLYSLGCVLYTLLTGVPPFRGKNIAEVVHKVRYEQHQPISKFVIDVPRDLVQIIDELLEKDPDDRIRTALSLTHRLRSIQQALSISTTGEDDFSSDAVSPNIDDRTNRIVNPPPDIAERPTVYLPPNENTATQKSKSEPLPNNQKRAKEKKKRDHFTRVELEHFRPTDSSRGSEFTSAVPLLLLLLTVLSGVIGGIWYSTMPLSADDLFKRIMVAEEEPSLRLSVSKDVDHFVTKFPKDGRIARVLAMQEEIAIQKLQRTLEIRARGRQETGKLSPVEVHCNEAFRAYRERDIETAIRHLEGIQLMFGSESDHTDIGIQRVLELVSRLLPQWKAELKAEVVGLEVVVATYRDRARELTKTEPDRAREIWQGILILYERRPWATEFALEAKQALQQLGPPPTKSEDLSEDEANP